ncbi:hypothetical protein [Spirosoma pomorum]
MARKTQLVNTDYYCRVGLKREIYVRAFRSNINPVGQRIRFIDSGIYPRYLLIFTTLLTITL